MPAVNISGVNRPVRMLLISLVILGLSESQHIKIAPTDNGANLNKQVSQSDFDIYGHRDFTIDDEKALPIAYYRSYPKHVQRLLQHADIESSICRNSSLADGLRACNRRDLLMTKIRAFGWCYTSPEHSGVTDHWMGCGLNGEVKPEVEIADSYHFNETDIREAGQAVRPKLPCRIAQPQLPEAGSDAAQRFDIFGKADYSAGDEKLNSTAEYLAFPKTLRQMMWHHDMEMGKCHEYGDAVESLRACNRRNRLLAQIEHRGWCWGSKDHISSKDRWIKCSDIAGYTPDQPRADSALYSLEDMRKAIEDELATCL